MANAFRKTSVSTSRIWGPRSTLGLALAALVFGLDQTVKWWLLNVVDLPARRSITITPFFDLKMAWNEGVSYGLFTTHVQAVLIILSVIVSGMLVNWLAAAKNPLVAASLGMIIGGALSNAFDRVVHGAVADFFYFHFEGLNFALFNFIFNPADVAIVAGVGLLLYDSVFGRKSG
jgi:signal peptidase II